MSKPVSGFVLVRAPKFPRALSRLCLVSGVPSAGSVWGVGAGCMLGENLTAGALESVFEAKFGVDEAMAGATWEIRSPQIRMICKNLKKAGAGEVFIITTQSDVIDVIGENLLSFRLISD